MSNSIVKVEYTADQVELIKRTVAKGATDDELAMYLHQCQKMGLDALTRQLVFQKYNTKDGARVSFITTVDAYRIIAERSGAYAGNDEPVFAGEENGKPAKATVTVWKIVAGQRVGFTASAYWAEYCPDEKRDHMWRKMPHVMLGKCAEAAALRKAFPNDLSGAYIREEMEQAGEVIDATPRPPMPRGNGHAEKVVRQLIQTAEANPEAFDAVVKTTEEGRKLKEIATADTVAVLPPNWLIEDGIVDNYKHAANLYKLLELAELDEADQRDRIGLYRAWREYGLDTKPAAAFAIEGKLPDEEPQTEAETEAA